MSLVSKDFNVHKLMDDCTLVGIKFKHVGIACLLAVRSLFEMLEFLRLKKIRTECNCPSIDYRSMNPAMAHFAIRVTYMEYHLAELSRRSLTKISI